MDELSQFHFLRPWWLLLIPLLLMLSLWLRKQQAHKTGFERWIKADLLRHISTGEQQPVSATFFMLPALWLIAVIALAGPTWKELPQPLYESTQAMVIALDLSPSMMAQDNKPSRIVRARVKIQDLLNQRKGGLTALLVYAGEAYVVAPLTDDIRTIANLLPTLEPGLLPIPGSNIEMAVELAEQVVSDSGLSSSSLVVITDGIAPEAAETIADSIKDSTELFILGVGTQQGAPIPHKGGFLKDKQQKTINATRNDAQLQQLARETSGYYLPLQADDSDIQFISNNLKQPLDQSRKLQRNADQWLEFGPTLLLLILPFIALLFRRGWLFCGMIVLSSFTLPESAHALAWEDLWLNKDQRAKQDFDKKDYAEAEKNFTDSQWQGSAAYKNQNYAAAVDAFRQGDTATDHYNRGNALSQLGELDEALEAYDTALTKDPNFEDAKYNKQVVEKLKQQQEKQQQNKQDQKNQEQDQEKQDQGQQGQDKQGQEDQKQQQNQPSGEENSQQGSSQQTPKEDSENNRSKDDQAKNNDADKKNAEQSQQDKDTEKAQDEADKAKQQAIEKQEENKDAEGGEQAIENPALAELDEEEKQALEQWIKKIPDDPSGLLRRKFDYQSRERYQQFQQGEWTLPKNKAHERY